jgi:hypothetical protein
VRRKNRPRTDAAITRRFPKVSKVEQVLDLVKGMTVLELAELVKKFESEFGVSAAAAVVAAPPPELRLPLPPPLPKREDRVRRDPC